FDVHSPLSMIARLYSATVIGVDGIEVEVEVDSQSANERHITIVGLPDTAVKESSQRVDSAIINSGFSILFGNIVVNLAPADLKKQGPSFDLPIALGMLSCASEPLSSSESWCILGELALDGNIRPVQGILPQVIEARAQGKTKVMLPHLNALEAAAIQGIEIYPVKNLREAWALLLGKSHIQPLTASPPEFDDHFEIDFDEIKGQAYARRAMEITAAGGHNVLMSGSPGSGKTMLAQRIATILPALSEAESLETSKIHSVCGLIKRDRGLISRRPFRAPHHTISDVGLMGGGSNITPGEVSLAHNGVLFLDELPEFRRQALETLRQPLESGQVIISRAAGTMTFPCRFMLIAAMNPCPCGYFGDTRRNCTCNTAQIARYRQKISGPLLDRFDLLLEVPAVDTSSLVNAPTGECSATIRQRVRRARDLQSARYEGTPFRSNSDLSGKALRKYCHLGSSATNILQQAIEQLNLSARAFDRILKVARTIADLAGAEHIEDAAIYEAVQMRSFENQLRL
ncbi:MAG: YifB family Mg chelatase-like AAA ATPase, partial [Akkermansia sp.]